MLSAFPIGLRVGMFRCTYSGRAKAQYLGSSHIPARPDTGIAVPLITLGAADTMLAVRWQGSLAGCDVGEGA